MKFQKSQFGGSNGGTDELIHIRLIFWIKKKLSVFSNVLLELFLELDDVFKDKFFLRSVFPVAEIVFG